MSIYLLILELDIFEHNPSILVTGSSDDMSCIHNNINEKDGTHLAEIDDADSTKPPL